MRVTREAPLPCSETDTHGSLIEFWLIDLAGFPPFRTQNDVDLLLVKIFRDIQGPDCESQN